MAKPRTRMGDWSLYCRQADVSLRPGESGGAVARANGGAGGEACGARRDAAGTEAARERASAEAFLLKFGISRGVGDGWVVSTARFWPQHMV